MKGKSTLWVLVGLVCNLVLLGLSIGSIMTKPSRTPARSYYPSAHRERVKEISVLDAMDLMKDSTAMMPKRNPDLAKKHIDKVISYYQNRMEGSAKKDEIMQKVNETFVTFIKNHNSLRTYAATGMEADPMVVQAAVDGLFRQFKYLTDQTAVDLSGCYLRGIDFSELDLKDVDFSGSTLERVKFDNCTFRRVNFKGTALEKYSYEEIAKAGRSLQLTGGK